MYNTTNKYSKKIFFGVKLYNITLIQSFEDKAIKFINPKYLPVSWIMRISSINNVYRQISKTIMAFKNKRERTNALQGYRADTFRIDSSNLYGY